MKTTFQAATVLWLSLMGSSVNALAGEDDVDPHAGHGEHHMGDEGAMSQMFLEKRQVDDYQLSFHVMPASQGMQHGGSHNLMIKIERDGLLVTDAQVNSKVIFPDGTDQQQLLHRMGDWYMAGYDMQGQARHQVMVLFRRADGEIHRSGVYYPK